MIRSVSAVNDHGRLVVAMLHEEVGRVRVEVGDALEAASHELGPLATPRVLPDGETFVLRLSVVLIQLVSLHYLIFI